MCKWDVIHYFMFLLNLGCLSLLLTYFYYWEGFDAGNRAWAWSYCAGTWSTCWVWASNGRVSCPYFNSSTLGIHLDAFVLFGIDKVEDDQFSFDFSFSVLGVLIKRLLLFFLFSFFFLYKKFVGQIYRVYIIYLQVFVCSDRQL